MRHIIAIVVLVVVAIACSGGEGQLVAVNIVDFDFDPARVEVPAGTTVAWTYGEGNSLHTVTFDDGVESGDLEPGDTYERTFDAASEHPYVCFYHPSMTGTISVVE